VQQVISAREA